MNKRVLECVAQTESLYKMGPIVFPSGNKGPFNPDTVKVFSDSQRLRVVAEEFSKIIKKLDVQIIVGLPLAGLPVAIICSQITGLPFVIVRNEKDPRTGEVINGEYKKGQKGVLIDDVIAKAGTKIRVLKNIGEELKIKDIIVLWEGGPRYRPNWRPWAKKKKIKVHYLYTWQEEIEYLKKEKAIPEGAANILLEYLEDPFNWSSNKKKWQRFLIYKRKSGKKTGEPL